jgi:hypothetical protein
MAPRMVLPWVQRTKSIIVVVPPNSAARLTCAGPWVRPGVPSGLGRCQRKCTCGSIPPGMTILPAASISRAPCGTGKVPCTATAATRPPATATSAGPAPFGVTTQSPRMTSSTMTPPPRARPRHGSAGAGPVQARPTSATPMSQREPPPGNPNPCPNGFTARSRPSPGTASARAATAGRSSDRRAGACPRTSTRMAPGAQYRVGCAIRVRLLARSGTTLPRRRRPRWLGRRAHRPVRDARR